MPEPVGHRNGHLFAGLELLYPDASPFKVDAVPLEEDAVFEPLPGIHSDVVDDPDFRLVHDGMPGIFKDFKDSLLLFAGEGEPPYSDPLFLAFPSEEEGAEGILAVPEFGQGGEDFAEPFDFAVVGIDGQSGFLQVLGELFGMLRGDLADLHPRIVHKADELFQRCAVLNLFADGGRDGAFGMRRIIIPDAGKGGRVSGWSIPVLVGREPR